jgi:hypothetical protein
LKLAVTGQSEFQNQVDVIHSYAPQFASTFVSWSKASQNLTLREVFIILNGTGHTGNTVFCYFFWMSIRNYPAF